MQTLSPGFLIYPLSFYLLKLLSLIIDVRETCLGSFYFPKLHLASYTWRNLRRIHLVLTRLLKILRCYELLISIQVFLENGKVYLSRSFSLEAQVIRLKVSEVYMVISFGSFRQVCRRRNQTMQENPAVPRRGMFTNKEMQVGIKLTFFLHGFQVLQICQYNYYCCCFRVCMWTTCYLSTNSCSVCDFKYFGIAITSTKSCRCRICKLYMYCKNYTIIRRLYIYIYIIY